MPQTIFKFYRAEGDLPDDAKHDLQIEISSSHLAFTHKIDSTVSDFEMFSYSTEEANDVVSLFETVTSLSGIANKDYSSVYVFFNHGEAMMAPAHKCNAETAANYLDVVYGESLLSTKVFIDKIEEGNTMVNAYRAGTDWLNILQLKYNEVIVNHLYSGIVNKMLKATLPKDFQVMKVQLYNHHLVAAVMQNGQLHIIQTFEYKTPEDVQYYLLSIVQQLKLKQEEISLQLSGMIDEFSPLYTGLAKYFKNMVFDNYFDHAIGFDISEHPSHYYTPFFNLSA